MIDKKYNIFDGTTELVSLDCSSITGEASSIYHNTSHSLQQSILNLKSVLPTFTSQFNLFKQEIIELSYIIVNKLMQDIKFKTRSISQLKTALEQSQSLNKSMKQQVFQLQDMISEFMDSNKREMVQKQKELNQKKNQVDQLKTILKQNFNSPRNLCKNCSQTLEPSDNPQQQTQSSKQFDQLDFKLKKFFNRTQKNTEILIQANHCSEVQINTRKSLEIIQQENSEVTSLADYLHSQRCSQKENTPDSIGEIIKSTRSGQDNQKEQFYTGKRSALNIMNINSDNSQNLRYLSDYDKTPPHDNQSTVGKIHFFQNLQNKNNNQIFSSRPNCENSQQNLKSDNKKERRNSQIILPEKNIHEGFKIQRKNHQRAPLRNKTPQNQIIPIQQPKQQLNLKVQLQQISKSSSCSDINHFGDCEKVNVNLPKKFQSPKNMNFLKQYHTHTQKDDRLRTEPSPKNQKYEINKQNIHIEYQPKANEMGRKIIARKKMIMTHAKASTSRIQTKKPLKQQCAQLINQPKYEDFSKKKNNFIQIKLIDSPQKQPSRSSHLIKPTIHTIFSASPQYQTVPRRNACMEYSSVNSNISAINESAVKSHHMYHSTDKYQSAETPKNIHKITMTPGKLPGKGGSKSKEKLKVMSKSVNQDQSMFSQQGKQSKQRFLAEMNSSFFSSCNSQSVSKIKNRNISIQIGNNSSNKIHMKQYLNDIRLAIISYDMKKIFTALREVYYDGKLVNGVKEGFGKVVYDNGIIYEGVVRNGKKEGQGKLILNGVVVFEGNFSNDMIEGQGNLRFFKYLTHSSCPCPKLLQNASYFGAFSSSQFNGMGTIFLNEKEKIVTKFGKGEPSGDLTFYFQNNIEFGHWAIE